MSGDAGLAAVWDTDDRDAVRTTMRRVHRSVARFSRNDSQDIVQEALARAVRAGVDCDAEAWLKVVARRIATDNARRAREVASEPVAIERLSRSRAASPEDIVVANESAGVIRKALNALPPRYRDALVTYASGQDHTEVARQFGISPNATWSLLCRARARLRRELDRVGYAFGLFGVRLQRWGADLATVGAVACIALGVVLAGPAPRSSAQVPPVDRSFAVVTVVLPVASHVASSASVAVSDPEKKVAKKVGKAVEQAKIVHYEVRACGLKEQQLPVGAHVSVLEDARPSLVAGALKRVPEPLRVMDKPTC